MPHSNISICILNIEDEVKIFEFSRQKLILNDLSKIKKIAVQKVEKIYLA